MPCRSKMILECVGLLGLQFQICCKLEKLKDILCMDVCMGEFILEYVYMHLCFLAYDFINVNLSGNKCLSGFFFSA